MTENELIALLGRPRVRNALTQAVAAGQPGPNQDSLARDYNRHDGPVEQALRRRFALRARSCGLAR